MSRNAHGMISDVNEGLLIGKRTCCEQESTGDDQQRDSMEKHIACKQKCAGDGQRWEYGSVDAERHSL